jgi:hypothetical protein
VPSQGGHESAPDPDEPDLTQQMMGIFETHAVFLNQMDQELVAYIQQYGDLESYVFDSSDLVQLNAIYGVLEALVEDDQPSNWEGYLGWGYEEFEDQFGEGVKWFFWINHDWTYPFAIAVTLLNINAALILGAILGLQQGMDSVSFRVLYVASLFIRNHYLGPDILLIENRGDQDPSNDDGVKLIVTNYYWPFRFLPEFVNIIPQEWGDEPPYEHGQAYIPYPA